jgi:NAD(P)H-dependent FMN reductase
MGCEGVRRPRRACAAASLCAHRFLCIRIDDAFSAESSAMKVLAISGSLRAASINSALIKNALDWLVSFEPFVNKPVAVLNASPRAHHADSALRETLKTMSAVIVESASISIPLLGAHISEGEMAELPSIAQAIRESLASLHRAVALRQSGDGPAFPV